MSVDRGELGGFHVVDPELYRRYRADVVALSNSHQRNINEFLDCMDSGLAGFQLGDVEAFFAPGQHEVVEPTNHIATVTDRGRGPCLGRLQDFRQLAGQQLAGDATSLQQ